MPIYARTSGGVYKAVSRILTADGSEIGKVVDSTGRIIYEASRLITVTGVPPISFTKSIGKPLVSWDLLGNGEQIGTPAPDNIIMPEFCGVRTGNLIPFPYSTGTQSYDGISWTMNSDGRLVGEGTSTKGTNYYIINQLQGFSLKTGDYTLSFQGTKNKNLILRDVTAGINIARCDGTNKEVSFTLSEDSGVLQLYFNVSAAGAEFDIDGYPMLNAGSTALPYEPYGYKIPFGIHGDNLANLILGKVPRASDGTLVTFAGLTSEYVPITSMSDTFSLTFDKPESTKRFYVYFYSGDTLTNTKDLAYGTTITTYGVSNTVDRMRIRIDYGESTVSNVMLNTGSTALPYSPYFSETVPVYLGQTQTVRRIKKLVLTGEETFGSSGLGYTVNISDAIGVALTVVTDAICSHYQARSYSKVYSGAEFGFAQRSGASENIRGFSFSKGEIETAQDFQTYLAAQYAAGTPVTIWYVLATPENGIVNEPLAKIGDYADELHSTDAGVTIPTTQGNNTLTVDTDLPPSSMTIVYKGTSR